MARTARWYWRRWSYVAAHWWRGYRWRSAQGELGALIGYTTAVMVAWGVPAVVVLFGMNG